MAMRSFGQLEHTLWRQRRIMRLALFAGVSLVVVAMAMPSHGLDTVTYGDGDNSTAALVLTDDTVGVVAADEAATQSGVVSGGFKFIKDGFGSLTLSGNNSFSGGLDLNAGILVLDHQNALGTGVLNQAADTVLHLRAPSVFVLANDVVLNGPATWRATNATHTGILSGLGKLLVEGRIRLDGNNTYSGGTEVADNGTLTVGTDTAIGTGAVTLGNSASLIFAALNTPAYANDMTLTSGYAGMTVAGDAQLDGIISGAGGIAKYGNGDLRLTNANSFTGGLGINGGTVRLDDDFAAGTGEIFIAASAELALADGIGIDNDIRLVNGAVIDVGVGTATHYGAMAQAGAGGGYFKSGSGELVLMGSANHGGWTWLQGGTITAGGLNVLSANAQHISEANTLLRLLDDQRVGNLSLEGTLDLGSSNVSIVGTVTGSTIGGTLLGDSSSSITMDSFRYLNFSADNATYDGQLIVNDGSVDVSGDYSAMRALVNDGRLSGSGRLGDVDMQGGTLVGTDGSMLTMNSLFLDHEATVLAQLGAPSNTALFTVANDITLDGTLDVEDVGGFGLGLYRLFDYGGTLTDNGMSIGDTPSGDPDDIEIQTSVAGQVNLISLDASSGDLLFWDGGNAALWDNSLIDGGSGTWRGTLNSFTTADGATNGAMNPSPGFAIFAGPSGTVTVDNTDGQAAVTGMQFASNGYTISGDDVELESGDAVIRVGDGTTAGANYRATIDSALIGDGALVKSDLGTLILSSLNNSYVGGTEVRGGTLEVNGRIDNVLVGLNGRLGGTGTVGETRVEGTLAAGNSIGTLTVDGDLTFDTTAIFQVEVDALGNADLVDVTGAAFLGGQVMTLASGGDYAASTEYTILQAAGGINGTFDGITSNLIFLDAALAYNANDVRLTMTRNGNTFGSIANTRNQLATGEAVEGLGAGNTIYDRVLTLSANDARAGFDQLSGEVHASLKGVLLTNDTALSQTMGDRVNGAFAALGLPADAQSGTGAWMSGNANFGRLDGDGNAADTSYSAGNLFVGADARFNQDWLFGVAVGYGHTGLSDGRGSDASADNVHVGAYGGGAVGNVTLKFGAGYTHHDIETDRTVTVPSLGQTLSADYAGGTGQVFGEIGHKFEFDSGLIIEPFVNFTHASLYTGSYAETGGSAALAGGSDYASTSQFTLGLRGEASFALGEMQARASGMVGWQHALGEVDLTATHAFAGGSGFTVAGSTMGRDLALIQAGIDLKVSENVNLGVTYDGQFGADLIDNGIKANLGVKF